MFLILFQKVCGIISLVLNNNYIDDEIEQI